MADVASSFKNWSASAASNNPTSATVIGSGLAPNLQQIQATLRTELGSRSAPVTAVSTVDLNAVDAGTVLVEHISGTVSISSFGTVQAGIKKLVTFSVTSGTLTLVYNATSMIIPAMSNIIVGDGDSLLAESLGSGNWKVHIYIGSIKNVTNDPNFASTSPTDLVSPEWAKGLFHIGTPVTANGAAAFDFAIPLGAKRVRFIFNEISTNGTSFVIAQAIVSGSPVIAGYRSTVWRRFAENFISAGFSVTVNTSPNVNFRIRGILSIENAGGNVWVSAGNIGADDGGTPASGDASSGSITLSGALEGVRITMVNGTDIFDSPSGTITPVWEF